MEQSYFEETLRMEEAVLAKKKARSYRFKIYTIICIVLAILAIFATLFLPGEWDKYSSSFVKIILLIGLIPSVLLIVGAFLFTYFRIKMVYEFDYIVVDGTVSISKVFSGIKRRKVIKFDCQDIILVGKVDTADCDKYEKMDNITFVLATPNIDEGDNNQDIYFVILNDKGQKIMLYFQPSLEFLMEMRRSAGRNIFEADVWYI